LESGGRAGAGRHKDVRGARCGVIYADRRLLINRSRIKFGRLVGIHQDLLKSGLRRPSWKP